jgi:hypothetical protein
MIEVSMIVKLLQQNTHGTNTTSTNEESHVNVMHGV